MKKNILLLCKCLVALMVTAGCAAAAPAVKKEMHPELTEQQKFIACSECHQEVTPELYQQWYDSSHGVAMVKCYQCHGTFETFRVTPKRDNCAVCHENMINKCPKDKACWQCHIPHTFKVQKQPSKNAAGKQ